MPTAAYNMVFALIGLCGGVLQGILLFCFIKRITGQNTIAALIYMMIKLFIYAAFFAIIALVFTDGLIAAGAGMGVGLFLSAAAQALISAKRNK